MQPEQFVMREKLLKKRVIGVAWSGPPRHDIVPEKFVDLETAKTTWTYNAVLVHMDFKFPITTNRELD